MASPSVPARVLADRRFHRSTIGTLRGVGGRQSHCQPRRSARQRSWTLWMSAPSCRLMGVVNVTPDSFSDGGLFLRADVAIGHGLSLVAEGADILDIGGESTRPGAEPVSVEDELRRVLPVVEGL